MDEIAARLACHHLSLPNSRLAKALDLFGSAEQLLAAELKDLSRLFREKEIQNIKRWRAHSFQEHEKLTAFALHRLKELDAALLAITDDDYPALLREIPDPPALLYISGDTAILRSPQIAIVGSRKMTPLGGKIAREFATELGRAGITITSGLALGVDSCAHVGALNAQAKTIAVLGTGIDGRYPRTNTALYEKIRSSGGLLVSEYPLGTPPRAANFPRRNRIITGLSMATLVVEASERSGSLVSARLAAEQGREVFAVPGSIRSTASSGCHQLIREGAILVSEPKHILEDIGPMLGLVTEGQPSSQGDTAGESPQSKKTTHWLLEALGAESLSIDELCDRCDMTVQEITSAITELELSGSVAASPFGFQRID